MILFFLSVAVVQLGVFLTWWSLSSSPV